MNKKNVQRLIVLMSNLPHEKFDITTWQGNDIDPCTPTTANAETLLHTCGTVACVAGWMGVLPEFQEDGGTVDANGVPEIEDSVDLWILDGADAVAYWLDIPSYLASQLCATLSDEDTERFYGVRDLLEIEPQMVVEKLNEILLQEDLTYGQ